MLLFGLVLVAAPATAHQPEEGAWVVSALAAGKQIAAGDVTILDVRPARAFAKGHVPGAVRVEWPWFSATSEPDRGKLLPDDALQNSLRAVGIFNDRPVLVVGDPPRGWGEDGRIVWMLRRSGHRRVALVDGGHKALVRAGVTMTSVVSAPVMGDFFVRPDPSLSAERDDVARAMQSKTVLIDTREKREYRGATPYGESRGGHVPGAKHVYFKDLLRSDGTLLASTELRKKFAGLGIEPITPVIAYCTGGIRSAWFVVALRSAGFTDVRNYAGSMWDWSAAPAQKFPLER